MKILCFSKLINRRFASSCIPKANELSCNQQQTISRKSVFQRNHGAVYFDKSNPTVCAELIQFNCIEIALTLNFNQREIRQPYETLNN